MDTLNNSLGRLNQREQDFLFNKLITIRSDILVSIKNNVLLVRDDSPKAKSAREKAEIQKTDFLERVAAAQKALKENILAQVLISQMITLAYKTEAADEIHWEPLKNGQSRLHLFFAGEFEQTIESEIDSRWLDGLTLALYPVNVQDTVMTAGVVKSVHVVEMMQRFLPPSQPVNVAVCQQSFFTLGQTSLVKSPLSGFPRGRATSDPQ